MRNRCIGVVVALAVVASACAGGKNPLEPTGPGQVVGNNVPPHVVASIAPTVTGATGGPGSDFTVKVGHGFSFHENIFNPQAMGRHIHYEVEAIGGGLDRSDWSNRDFDEPHLPSSVGAIDYHLFNYIGDRTWRVSLVETGGNLPQSIVLSASVTVHVVP